MKTNLSKLWLLVALLLMAACGGSHRGGSDDLDDEDEEEEMEQGYQTPAEVDDDDWQTVSADGATIEEDDITIVFPSGTFQSDTEVAVSEVEEGKMFGDREASTFYQLMVPAKIDNNITVTIKSDGEGGDLRFMASAPGYRRTTNEQVTSSIALDATASGDEYTVVLPKSNNDEDDGMIDLTFGLIRTGKDKRRDDTARANVEGTVKNISWYFDGVDNLKSSDKSNFKAAKADFNAYVKDALEKIHELGFSMTGDGWKIPYQIKDDLDKDNFGNFVQSKAFDSWNTVEINVKNLAGSYNKTALKQTIIHETLHYFQSNYDPRSCSKKNYSGEETVLAEAASVWIEQFMDGGKLNAAFVSDYLDNFIKGLEDIEHIYPHKEKYGSLKNWWSEWWANELQNYAHQGYAMSTLLYFLTHPKSQMEAFGITKKSIVELFQIWKSNEVYPGRTFIVLRKWMSDHDSGFLYTDQYDDFLVYLVSGKFIVHDKINPEALRTNKKTMQNLKEDDEKIVGSHCFDMGCDITPIAVGNYLNDKGEHTFKGKDIVIRQLTPDVRTRVFVKSKKSGKFLLMKGKTILGDSIVLNGEDFDKVFSNDSVRTMWLVTTNHSGKKVDFKVSVKIRDQEEKAKNVRTFRTNMYVDMKVIKSENIDGQTTESTAESKDYTIGYANLEDRAPRITTTVSGKTLKVMCVDEEGGKKETLSYDILNFSDVMKDTLMKQMRVANVAYDLHTVYQDYSGRRETHRSFKVAGPLKFAGNEPFGNSFGKYTFSKMEMDGLKMEYLHKTTETGSDGKVTVTEYKFVPDKFNSVMISLEFYPNKKTEAQKGMDSIVEEE